MAHCGGEGSKIRILHGSPSAVSSENMDQHKRYQPLVLSKSFTSNHYHLTQKHLEEYRGNGVVVLKNIFNPKDIHVLARYIKAATFSEEYSRDDSSSSMVVPPSAVICDNGDDAGDAETGAEEGKREGGDKNNKKKTTDRKQLESGKYSDNHSDEERPPKGQQRKIPFLRLHNLWKRSSQVEMLVTSKRLCQAAAKLLGVDSVRLYQDSAFFKQPGDTSSPWHQDQLASPFTCSTRFVTFWIPLTNLSREQGLLRYAKGSHVVDYKTIGHKGMPLEKVGSFESAAEQKITASGFRVFQMEAVSIGDAVAHHGWLLHSSSPNTTNQTRYAFAVSYYEDGGRVNSHARAGICDDLHQWSCWVSKAGPGGIANCDEHTPLVWPSST
eukprot:CAMPEP_0185269728 /NCGR_PEP_ID=MMETSP1359-20130426/40656_1 /TAXON_ID=552665 /ORGANISM="Bigelowiella longifila, Strain CCMP242" /LENGTH=382 /DNA_ID=CAMNT_0027861037 /DNA_START=61 /DNA_END=1209 /DNA_ORIENTATION=-